MRRLIENLDELAGYDVVLARAPSSGECMKPDATDVMVQAVSIGPSMAKRDIFHVGAFIRSDALIRWARSGTAALRRMIEGRRDQPERHL